MGESSGATAVLLCPAWGWDEVMTYRSRLAWAQRLAAAGHPTLRIDLPGTGDSAGSPADPDRVGAWVGSIRAAAAWLAAEPGVARVAAIGLGLGGLLAGQAIEDGAPIDDLALWATPTRGRAYLREQRAFAALQSSRLGLAEEATAVLPPGWLEVGGFVLTEGTMAAIDALDLRGIGPGRIQRALLLGRDGLPVDAELEGHLRSAGVSVEVAPGDGWGQMTFDLERYQPPLAVFDRVGAWLEAAPDAARRTPAEPDRRSDPEMRPRASDHAELVVDGARVREYALGHDDQFGSSFGILAEPVDGPTGDLCAIFLNAGAIRRIGPNRIWVEVGRRWAARGVPAFRVDVEGIGDADGDAGIYADVARFYTPDREPKVIAMMDALEARGIGRRFVLLGLCAGAYSGLNTAAVDKRVMAVIAINPRVLVWDPGLLSRREARLMKRVVRRGSWRRVLTGETSPARVVEIIRTGVIAGARATIAVPARRRERSAPEESARRIVRLFDVLRDLGTRVVLPFSDDEPVYEELEFGRDPLPSRALAQPGHPPSSGPGSHAPAARRAASLPRATRARTRSGRSARLTRPLVTGSHIGSAREMPIRVARSRPR